MKIQNIKINELLPYEKNAKKHDKTQINNVAESIKQYGFVQPIVIDENKTVIIGHCRLLSAKKLKLKEVPCILVNDLTEEQIKALRIVDNKSNESEWDLDFLRMELDDIDLSMFDFDFLGENFSPDEFIEDFTLPSGDKSEICQMTFTLHEKQKELIEYSLSVAKNSISETFGNANSNGNALYEVIRQWVELRT